MEANSDAAGLQNILPPCLPVTEAARCDRTADYWRTIITPRNADAFARCPMQFVHGTKDFGAPSIAQQRGNYLHALLARYSMKLICGVQPSIRELLLHVPPPRTLSPDGAAEDLLRRRGPRCRGIACSCSPCPYLSVLVVRRIWLCWVVVVRSGSALCRSTSWIDRTARLMEDMTWP